MFNSQTASLAGKISKRSKDKDLAIIEKLSKHIDKDEAILKLKALIDEGNFKAIQLYMAYMYGKPKETKDVTINTEQPLFSLS